MVERIEGISPEPSGDFHVNDDGGNVVFEAVRAWAEHVLRQAERVDEAHQKRDWINYALDNAEPDWGLDEHMYGERARALWAEQVTLVWAAHQLHQWLRRLDQERGSAPRDWDTSLRNWRDALEHLDDAVIDATGTAQADPSRPKGDRALRALGGSMLMFNLRLDTHSLSAPARGLLGSLDDMQDELAEDVYAQDQIDRLRGR